LTTVVLVRTGAVAAVTVLAGAGAARAEDRALVPVAVDAVVGAVKVAPAVPGEVRTAAPRTPETSSVDGIVHRRITGSTDKAPLDADRVS
jgi:hypothetical protein